MKKTNQRKYDLENRLILFAISVCDIAEQLPDTTLGNHIAKQLFRAGTSPAPNYGEAQGAESKKDFVHKMRICLKELRETGVWLRLLLEKQVLDTSVIEPVLNEGSELIAIFTASVKTAGKS